MGSFSWKYADNNLEYTNICPGDKYKMLIPSEFGGGEITDIYKDYGDISTPWGESDIYSLLAFMNNDKVVEGKSIKDSLKFNNIDYFPETVEDYIKHADDDYNRHYGISIGCYDKDMNTLNYPLKLVSEHYNGTYENCNNISFSDPYQGFFHTYRDHREELEDSIDYDDDDWMYDDDDDFDDCEYDDVSL